MKIMIAVLVTLAILILFHVLYLTVSLKRYHA